MGIRFSFERACTIGSFVLGPNIPPEGQIKKLCAAFTQALYKIRIAAIGTNHDSDLAEGRLKHWRIGSRSVANQLVLQLMFAILAEELAVGVDEDGRVIAMVAVGFEHAGHQVDV